MDLMRIVGGNFGAGPQPRSIFQAAWEELPLSQVEEDLSYLLNMCESSQLLHSAVTPNEDELLQLFHQYSNGIAKNLMHGGGFSSQHVVGMLAGTTLLQPPGVLQCARFAMDSSQFKEKPGKTPRNPMMSAYIKAGKTRDVERKVRLVLETALAYARHCNLLGKTQWSKRNTLRVAIARE